MEQKIDGIGESQLLIKRLKHIIDTDYNGNNSTFAKILGVSESKIRSYLRGTLPKYDFFIMLNSLLHINLDWLFNGEGKMTWLEYEDSSKASMRMIKFIDSTGLFYQDFNKQVGLQEDFNLLSTKSLKTHELFLILKKFPNLNIYWLITGKGKMLLTKKEQLARASKTPAKIYQQEATVLPTAEQQRLEDKVRYLESMLATQQKLIASYEQQLNIQDNNKQQAG
jgi:hypothetical protein